MRVGYREKAIEQLRALSKQERKRITDKIDFFASQGDPLSFAKPLMGYAAFRFRIGDFRVIFQITGTVLDVLLVVKREGAYRNL